MLSTTTTSWAASYRFTFTGADLMSYYASLGYGDATTPATLPLLDGALKFKPSATGVPDLYSWRTSTQDAFNTMATTSGYGLATFHLWGYGGDAATFWGETLTLPANSWTNTGTADSGWASGLLSDAGTGYQTVLSFGRTITGAAIAFGGPNSPNFSFTIDLPDSTTWLDSTEGKLAFWFGGYLVDSDYIEVGTLQGNMVLTGTQVPVPEPTTLLLFGAGLIGMVAVGRKNQKNAH